MVPTNGYTFRGSCPQGMHRCGPPWRTRWAALQRHSTAGVSGYSRWGCKCCEIQTIRATAVRHFEYGHLTERRICPCLALAVPARGSDPCPGSAHDLGQDRYMRHSAKFAINFDRRFEPRSLCRNNRIERPLMIVDCLTATGTPALTQQLSSELTAYSV